MKNCLHMEFRMIFFQSLTLSSVHVTLAHPATQGTLLNINLNILRKCYSIDTEFRRYTANLFDFYINMNKN